MTASVLAFGWDAADRQRVQRLIAEGQLPALAAIRQRGATHEVAPLLGLSDDALWATFSTTKPPGTHGRFNHRQPEPGSYLQKLTGRWQTNDEPFWAELSRSGRRVGVIDIPKSPIVGEPINGLEIVDWMPHGRDASEVTVMPSTHRLANELSRDREFECHRNVPLKELPAHVAEIGRRAGRHLEHCRTLMAEESWDLFLTATAATHCGGHHLTAQTEFHDQLDDLYRQADRSLAALVEAAGPKCCVVIFSLVGMSNPVLQDRLLDAVLDRIDELGDARSRTPLRSLHRRAFYAVPRPRRARAPRWLRPRPASADRKEYRVRHGAISSAIRLNVVGRETHGRIQPGIAFDQRCAQLERILLDLVDETGRPVVDEVVRTSEHFPGPRHDAMADLLVLWNQAATPGYAESSLLGPVRVQSQSTTSYRGNHRPGGWVTLSDPAPQLQPSGASIDVAELGPLISRIVAGRPSLRV